MLVFPFRSKKVEHTAFVSGAASSASLAYRLVHPVFIEKAGFFVWLASRDSLLDSIHAIDCFKET